MLHWFRPAPSPARGSSFWPRMVKIIIKSTEQLFPSNDVAPRAKRGSGDLQLRVRGYPDSRASLLRFSQSGARSLSRPQCSEYTLNRNPGLVCMVGGDTQSNADDVFGS